MIIYIRTDNDWLVLESCPNPIYNWVQTAVTEEQFELIKKQYDTIIKDWVIVSQEKWQNAIDLENSLLVNEEQNVS